MNPLTLLKIVAVSCLVASCANASSLTRQARNLQQASSQLEPRSAATPAEAVAKAAAQQAKLHYVEIDPSLKGNYKFGYDTGSGPAGQSFREETRLDDGTVKGAYGYVDANGKQRIVKYTAGKAGFVVEGDQEAPGQQGAQAAPAPAAPAANLQQVEPARRPQAVSLPQHQPTFDENQEQQLSRAVPTAEDRARAEQQHAEQLRQHQLATQAALAQQQRLAQQLQLQQQQIVASQRQAPAQQPPQQQPAPAHQFAAIQQLQQQQQQQQHFQQPRHHAHIVDPQSGSFFSASNDANLDQLLKSQLAQLQSSRGGVPEQFLSQHQRQAAASPVFQQAPAQQAPDFNQFRAARQAPQAGQFQQHHQQAALSPHSALAALQQQQQQDAQMLAHLRAQQLARLQEQSRQSPQPQQVQAELVPAGAAQFRGQPQAFASQSQPLPTHQRAPAPESFGAPQRLASGPAQAQAAAVAVQPENFGPPVIDIRTLNYSIGQQTQV